MVGGEWRGASHLTDATLLVSSTDELVAQVLGELPRLFAPIRRAAFYLTDSRTGLLTPRGILGTGLDAVVRRSGLLLARRPTLQRAVRNSPVGSLISAPFFDRGVLIGLLAVERTGGKEFQLADLDQLTAVSERIAAIIRDLDQLARRQRALWFQLRQAMATGPDPTQVDPEPRFAEGTRTDGRVLPPAPGNGRDKRRSATTAELLRIELDLRMARDIQRHFLPSLTGELEGLQIAATYRPAFEVGGDFYDLVVLADGRFVAIIGDVSGKGVSAALIMSQMMTEFRAVTESCASPASILKKLNAHQVSQNFDDSFVTAACVLIDPANHRVVVANAGHVPPLIRCHGNQVTRIGAASGAPLGLVCGETYREDVAHYAQDDVLLLMTDGITEAFDPLARSVDEACLYRAIRDADRSVDRLAAQLIAEVERVRARRADDIALRADDIALLAVQLP